MESVTDLSFDISTLVHRLRIGVPRVAVMGLGHVGLPVALAFVRAGCNVVGFDVNGTKVEALQLGESYIRDVRADEVREALHTQRFAATIDSNALAEADAVLICVPTPFTAQKEPDVSYIEAATRAIALRLNPGQVIILRSTSYPGTTNGVVRPILEAAGFQVGRDLFLAFAPERIDPGNRKIALEDVPIVVGGTDPDSTRLATALLGRVTRRTIEVSSPEAAEMTKLLENVFRNVNIALVNQIAQLCDRMGLSVWEIVEAAATKPYGFMSFRPGLVGGHCIPVDPYFLAWKAREYDFHMDFIELAARVNEEMPFYIVSRVLGLLHERGETSGSRRALVVGIAFKKDVNDARHSPALKVMEILERHRIDVTYHDPYITQVTVNERTLQSVPLSPAVLAEADCVLILTDHSSIDYEALVDCAKLVFDARNATEGVRRGRGKIIRL